jgi:hypothetical protein
MCDKIEECETEIKHEIELVEKEQKWSTSKFFIGIAKILINMATVSWAVYTYFAQIILSKIFTATNGELTTYLTSPVMIILVSGWVVVSIIMGCNLQKAVSTMIENAKITAEIKAGASFNKNIDLKGTADAAQIVSAVKN